MQSDIASVTDSTELEDWLNIGTPDTHSIGSFSLEQVLNDVDQLEDIADIIEEDDLIPGSLSSPIHDSSQGYVLSSLVSLEKMESISHQLNSLSNKMGSPVAVSENSGKIAIATSKGTLLIFDGEGRLERFCAFEGSASCVSFSSDGRRVAIGYSDGNVKVLFVGSGEIIASMNDVVQPGRGVLQVLFLNKSDCLLVLDNGGSVFEIRLYRKRLSNRRNHKIRCIFSGCNGEVVHMQVLPHHLVAFITVSKVMLITTRNGGAIQCSFPMSSSSQYPPLFHYMQTNAKVLEVICGRGKEVSWFKLDCLRLESRQNCVISSQKIPINRSIVCMQWIRQDTIILIDENGRILVLDPYKSSVTIPDNVQSVAMIFSSSDYKGLATGGHVSEALHCMADLVCYPSVYTSDGKTYILTHDALMYCRMKTEQDQLDIYLNCNDMISACLYLVDVIHRRVRCSSDSFRQSAWHHLNACIHRLVEITVDGLAQGKISDLMQHYKKHIDVLLRICFDSKQPEILYDLIYPRLCLDELSRRILLESLDEWVLDGAVTSPPASLVSDYICHLASQSHFSQLQAAIVRFPIDVIDINYVMLVCRQNGLYDGIIYVMNKALLDYLSPFEEMLSIVNDFAGRELLSDAEVEHSNRIFLYLHCCLVGQSYPIGSLPDHLKQTVPLEIFRCLTLIKEKEASPTKEKYPYIRLLLKLDAQQFVHVVCTSLDSELFSEHGRLQRLTEIIGLVAVELNTNDILLQFLSLSAQLTENKNVLIPIDSVTDAIICYLRLASCDISSDRIIVNVLRLLPQINRSTILRRAQSPLRLEICTFIYSSERQFIDMINCYVNQKDKGVFIAIRAIQMEESLTIQEKFDIDLLIRSFIKKLSLIDATETAQLVIDYYPDILTQISSCNDKNDYYSMIRAIFDIKKDRDDKIMTGTEEVDEILIGIVIEGIISEGKANMDSILQEILTDWAPIGSRTDFCLNLVSEAGCVFTSVLLLEARGFIDRAFLLLAHTISLHSSDDESVGLERILWLCCRHPNRAREDKWLLRLVKNITESHVDENNLQNVRSRLDWLCTKIVESGSEAAIDLLFCLLQYQPFQDSQFTDYSWLITSILSNCAFEAHVLNELMYCFGDETSSTACSLLASTNRRIKNPTLCICIVCGKGLLESSLIYNCGHMIHSSCISSHRTCPCLINDLDNFQRTPSSHYFISSSLRPRVSSSIESRDIFIRWGDRLPLC